jgi:acyl-coenzyme A thioesterase PaaI-like protein
MHGGALGALCVHVLETTGADDVVPVRFTADFVRPLLRQPLTIDAQVVRSGKRLEVVEGRVLVGEMEAARVSLLSIRPLAIELPDGASGDTSPPPDSPDDFALPFDSELPHETFYGHGIEPRAPEGFQSGVSWFRLALPTIPGIEPSPMARAVAAADFGLGISSHGEWPPKLAYPNADLVVHCARPVRGDWVRVKAQSVWTDDGIGLCTMQLYDTTGAVGTAAQSQVLSPTG